MFNIPDHVEHPQRYAEATRERIKANARKGKNARWLAEDATRADLIKALHAAVYGSDADQARYAELCARYDDCEDMRPADQNEVDALRKRMRGGNPFLFKMITSYDEWGSLTVGQEAAIRKSLAQDATRKAEWAEKRRAEGAASNHVGKVGERQDFALTVRNVMEFSGDFGDLFINILADEAGNVVVYKGSKRLGIKGAPVKVKATVKEHGERDGTKQTVISRPKVLA